MNTIRSVMFLSIWYVAYVHALCLFYSKDRSWTVHMTITYTKKIWEKQWIFRKELSALAWEILIHKVMLSAIHSKKLNRKSYAYKNITLILLGSSVGCKSIPVKCKLPKIVTLHYLYQALIFFEWIQNRIFLSIFNLAQWSMPYIHYCWLHGMEVFLWPKMITVYSYFICSIHVRMD